jgi:hypothetical protein
VVRAVVAASLLALGVTTGTVVLAPVASAYPSASVTLSGHGYGHGRGMGQWGAFGYALAGFSWQQIVQHYYQGSAPALTTPQQEGQWTRVALTENNDNDVIITSGVGFTLAGTHIGAGRAARMHIAGNGLWSLSSAPGCAGPWTGFGGMVTDPEAVPDQNSVIGVTGQSAAAAMALQLCQVGGNLSVRGMLEATFNSASAARTVNILPVEDYVAGVVPNESPSYWGQIGAIGTQGRPLGFQALEAQAVAARSYMAAARGSYGGYADTCDLSCQTYRGLANESPVSDAATLDTLGYVMEIGANGVPLTTEYSASTGGYTAPGNFPAVPDAGDAVCPPGINGACNPNHDWKASIPVSTIVATWPQLGSLVSISITGRNGFGDLGGRVTSMTLVGTSQNVVVTGDQFAAGVNLLSDWFTLTNTLPSAAVSLVASHDSQGYWIDGSDGSVVAFGDAPFLGSQTGHPLAAPVVGMANSASGNGYWQVAADGGVFSYGDAHFFGSTGGLHLNQPIVGMARTTDGNGYWLVASDGGIFSYGDAHFYGSTGGMQLNRPIVGMAVTPDSKGYWLVASDGGIFAFGDAHFYGSTGGMHLNRPVVGMAEAPGGTGYWMVASDGGIFAFGSAPFHGSAGGIPLVQPVVAMARTDDGGGYWLVAADGGVFTYGDAVFHGSAAG